MKAFKVVMVTVMALLVARGAFAGTFTSVTTGNWNTDTNPGPTDTWGAGIRPNAAAQGSGGLAGSGVNFPWSGDTAIIAAGTHVTANYAMACCGWDGTGVHWPTDVEIHLDGGTLGWQGGGIPSAIIYSPIKVKQGSNLYSSQGTNPGVHDGVLYDGVLSDFAPGVTGKITLNTSNRSLSLAGDCSGFSGGWDIADNDVWFGAWDPPPSSGGDTCLGTGPVESDGGWLRFHFNAGTLNNPMVLGTNGLSLEDGRGDLGTGYATLAGPISGPGTLTVDADYSGDRIQVTNPNNTYGGLRMIGNASMVVGNPGACGAGLISVESGNGNGTLKLDSAGGSDWDLTRNDLVITSGKVEYEAGVTNISVHALTLGTDTFPDGTYDIHSSYTSNEGNLVDFSGYFIGASTVIVQSTDVIPEPAALSLLGLGLLGRRRRRR
jgi:hypothetical protein